MLNMRLNISKITTSAVLAGSSLLYTATAAFADGGGTNPYQPHPPVDSGLASDEYFILLTVILLVAGTFVVSYGKYLKNTQTD